MPNAKTLRWFALLLAYRQADYIEYAIRGLAGHVDSIVVMFSDLPFTAYNHEARALFGGDDGTAAILDRLGGEIEGLTVITGLWNDEESMRTEGLTKMRQLCADVCLIVDADEFYDPATIECVKDFVAVDPTPGTVFWCRYVNCYRRADYIIDAPRLRLPVAVTIANDTRFVDGRVPNGRRVDVPAHCHYWHMGYVLSNERMWEKIRTFSHAHEVPDDWFQTKWLSWTPESVNLCRRQPARWPRTLSADPAQLPQILHSHPYVAPLLSASKT